MCGICGKLNLFDNGPDHRAVVRSMADQMVHRGPDDADVYSDSYAALGHRRLSIIDLATGKQPISNEDGSVLVVFNGEIYNFKELREQLLSRGHQFSTATDTEVIVHLYEEYGDGCVSKLDGMFAFAIWDRRQRRLLVARDRLGIKPLYYVETARHLMFASEIKALLADPACPRNANPVAVDRLLQLGYCAGRETPLLNVLKLEPGHYLTVSDGKVRVEQYWDLQFPRVPRKVSFAQARAELLDLLDRTVRSHMISDVPVGVLLSGGVDSTGVLSFAVDHADRPVHTFTIGFDGDQVVDERPFARLAAARYGAVPHETTIGPDEFREFLPRYVWHMEEMVCEPPAIALYYVTKLAREHGVKVVLSGEGGDEAFAGYNTYRNQLRVERIRLLGSPWRQTAAALANVAVRLTGRQRLACVARQLQTPLEQRYLSRTSQADGYFARRTNVYTDDFFEALSGRDSDEISALFGKVRGATPLSQMLYIDSKTWLPDDLLIKADKITMANSVELRVPLLDHHVLEFAAGLPDSYKVRGASMKHILKEALRQRVPREILDRPKAGFPIPVSRWLSSELHNYASDVLSDSRTYARGYLRRSAIDGLLAEHRRFANRGKEIFSLLVMELWHRQFIDPIGACAARPA